MLRSDEFTRVRSIAEPAAAVRIAVGMRPETEGLSDLGDDLALCYVRTLVFVAETGKPIRDTDVEVLRRLGVRAAREGVDLAPIVRVCSAGARAVGNQLSASALPVAETYEGASGAVTLVSTMLETADAALNALTAGHTDGVRDAIAAVTPCPDEFVDKLLAGSDDVTGLVRDAERVGFHPALDHFVALVRGDSRLPASSRMAAWLRSALRANLDHSELIVTVHDNYLVAVCRAGPGESQAVSEVLGRVLSQAMVNDDRCWRAAIGRPHRGLRGVQLSYQDAMDGLQLGGPVDTMQVVDVDKLLLARVLSRDRCAMADLIRSVLNPLTEAKNGVAPLLETLEAYFRCCCVTTDAAKELFLSVRAVTYRLYRIKMLTGYDVVRSVDRLTLQVAVAGARLLGWPQTELPDTD